LLQENAGRHWSQPGWRLAWQAKSGFSLQKPVAKGWHGVNFVFCLNTATENDDQFSLPWTEYTSL
jgi:hypothetical protein